MSSSAHQHQPLSNAYGATIAPPPTPAKQSNLVSSSDAADALSRLFHQLPPSLSLPPRLSPRTVSPPLISYSPQNPNFLNTHLSSFSQLGFFQLTENLISSELAKAAESESFSLFNLSKAEKKESFSKTWPLGYDDGDDNNNSNERPVESFCLDSSCFTESTHSFQELTSKLEVIGLQTVEALSCAMGFEKHLKEQDTRFSSLMWVSEGGVSNRQSGRFYPYIISLQYQIRCTKYSVLTDSGWVSVSPQVDSVLVTVGDIAQVWSNGRLKKVRGRPVAVPGGNDDENSQCITMSLLMTLPTDTTVTISPFLSDHHGNIDDKDEEDKAVFDAFSFEDYAWRVYHERFLFKDPLERYRSK